MTINYLSKYHSEDDPGGLIREVLNLGSDFPGPAEDILLSWTLRLGATANPAEHAKRLLAAYEIAEGPVPDDPRGRLIALLREAAAFSPATMVSPGKRGAHRPSRRRRRDTD